MRNCLRMLIAVIMVAVGVDVSNAQDSAVTDQVTIRAGIYEEMDLWDHIKLGTAPYISPQLLTSTSVGYAFDLDDKGWSAALGADLYDYFLSNQYTLGKILPNDLIEIIPLNEKMEGGGNNGSIHRHNFRKSLSFKH